MSNDEAKDIHKICPILGSHLKTTTSSIKGIALSSVQGAEQILSLCMREKCQLWDESVGNCRIALIPTTISWLTKELEGIVPALRDIQTQITLIQRRVDGHG